MTREFPEVEIAEDSSPFVRHRVLLLAALGVLLYPPFLGLRDL